MAGAIVDDLHGKGVGGVIVGDGVIVAAHLGHSVGVGLLGAGAVLVIVVQGKGDAAVGVAGHGLLVGRIVIAAQAEAELAIRHAAAGQLLLGGHG